MAADTPVTTAWSRVACWAWVGVLTFAISGPVLLHRGFVLIGDMVFVPQQPWKAAWYGGDGGIPRAVPSDAVVSLLTQVIPGDLLQAAVLVSIPLIAGGGIVALTREWPAIATMSATTLYVWNPYVDERFGIGHWALLCGYAALPWVLLAARSAALGEGVGRRMGWWGLVPALALAAGSSPSGGLMALALATITIGWLGGWWRGLLALGLGVMVNLPWLVPALIAVPGSPTDPFGVAAFAARPDTPWGLFGSLVSMGGIWKTSVVSPVRGDPVLSLLAVLLSAAGLLGAMVASRSRPRGVLAPLGALALAALGGTWLLSVPMGSGIADWIVTQLPGGGVIRDTQKWLAPWCLLVALGVGEGVRRALPTLRRRRLVWTTVAGVVLPILLLPTLGWGRAGDWQPTPYPAEWRVVDARLQADGTQGRVVSLPFTVYRRYAWNEQRAVLDPAPRFFAGQVITDDELGVGAGRAVGGESSVAARVRAVRDDPEALAEVLRAEHVRWVLEQKGTPGVGALPADVGRVVHDGVELRLVDLGPSSAAEASAWARPLLILDALLAAVVGGCALGVVGWSLRRRSPALRRGPDH
ncbi:MAG: hypothetical protein WAW88_10410 [Nocardioides sp.]